MPLVVVSKYVLTLIATVLWREEIVPTNEKPSELGE